MIYLAIKESFERGKAFEDFISILLSKLGYKIENTRIRKSGCEIDIQARCKVTGVSLLVECKALSKKVTGPDLNKFYGKYEHEYFKIKNSENIIGLMISLSGFNSEVIANYQEKGEDVKQRFKLLGPEEITKLSVEADLISDDSVVIDRTRQLWPFELGNTLLIITDTRYYRLQFLNKGTKTTHFIVYRAKCEDPTDYEIKSLQESMVMLKDLEVFNLSARKEILIVLSEADGFTSISELANSTKQSKITIETELEYLKERNLIEEVGNSFVLVPDIRTFCEVSIILLPSSFKYRFLLSKYFKDMNNIRLSDYCLERRYLDIQEENIKVSLNRIFQYSPSALKQALFGDITIYRNTYEHAKSIGKFMNKITDIGSSSFLNEIIVNLATDLKDKENLLVRKAYMGIKEDYSIAIASSTEKILSISSGSISLICKVEEAVEAGKIIVASDLFTIFDSYHIQFHLTQDPSFVLKMEEIYEKVKIKNPFDKSLAKMANNIGVCYMELKEWEKAKKWLEQGLSIDNNYILEENLSKVSKEIQKK